MPATTAAVAGLDLNGDGRADLVAANQPFWGGAGFVTVRLQDATRPGGFQAPLRSAAGPNPVTLALSPAGIFVAVPSPVQRPFS